MKTIITFLTSALCVLGVAAQLHFRHLPANSSLSSNMVNTIFQDNDGSIYFGTASGLNRYDGYDIRAFLHQSADSTSLHDNYVRRLQRGPDGRLWILAGNTYGIFDPATESFDNNVGAELAAMGIHRPAHTILIEDSIFWVYARGEGVYRAGTPEGTVRSVAGIDSILARTDITDLALGADGRSLFMVSNAGVLYTVDTGSMALQAAHRLPIDDTGSKVDYSLYVDSDNLVWVFGSKGLFAFNPLDSRWLSSMNGTRWPMDIPKTVFQDSHGRLWIGYDHIGLAVLDKNGHLELYQTDDNDERSLPANTVTAIMEDKSGTIWIGTRKKGVSIWNKSIYKFGFEPRGDVNCILRDHNGNLWLGTDTEGVRKIDAASGSVVSYLPAGTTQQAVVCLTEGADGTIWGGTYDCGLLRMDNRGVKALTKENGLVSNDIWSVIENPDGTLLLGTLGEGIQILNPATMESRVLNTSNSGLISDFISSMCAAPDGRIYLGTAEGVSVYNRTTGRIDTVVASNELSNPNVNQVFTDSRGLLWIATRDGLNVYDPRRDQCREVPLADTVNKSFILGIAEDLGHNMWFSAGGNLFNIKVRQEPDFSMDIRRYDATDGLQGCDFNQRSFCLMPDGELLVGGLYGINRFYPERIEYNNFAPSVRFTGLSLLGQPVEIGKSYDGRVILPQAIGTMERIKLNHNRNEFSVMFATDDYALPEHTRFSYILEGFNTEWTTLPDGVHQLSYTNLAPGSYTLRVRALNNDGIGSAAEASLGITILPPFYATTWAKVLYALLIIGAIAGAYVLIRRREREKYRRRTREEGLRKQEELNQLKFKFFTNISHDLRTPLTLITAPLESLLKKEHDETTRRQLNIMQTNANRLLNLVNQLLDFRKNEMSGLTLHASQNDIVAFVRQICDSFLMFSEKKNINFALSSSCESLQMVFDQDKMGKTIMNLLSNAFKFTPEGGSVRVELTTDDDTLLVRVADTGIGISDEDKAHIFDRFYQASNSPEAIAGSGIGLSLVAEYVKLHGGTVGVDNAPGGGTVFTVRVPIRRMHDGSAEPSEKKEPVYDSNDRRSKILVVDDNPDLLEFISQELSADFRVYTASNGREALDKMPELQPDMIVCDIMMPVMDGIELCRRVKSDAATAAIPLMLLTAKHDVGAKIEGLTLGADDYMTKPFDMDILRLRINKLLALKKKGMRRPLIDPEPAPLQITSLDEQLVEKAVNYVEANMERPELTVEELSGALGMSRVHLYKRIKELTGKTPVEFIRVMRLKRAAQLLRESQLNVSEIAYRCGFNHPKYFSRYFKEEFGVLPSVYQDREGI